MLEVPARVRFDEGGLVPVVVQDRTTGAVLMVAWADRDALDATAETGLAHFHSRSRDELWQKGETSGNTMQVTAIRADCDRDTILYQATPAGPACHTGQSSCFDDADLAGFYSLERLDAVIADRAQRRPEGSYTVRLLQQGVGGPAGKVIEEAAEVVEAAQEHAAGHADDRRVAEEAGDLVYHLLVLLAERGVPFCDVVGVLGERRR
jgi:phosphoribosyl-ATP pyrophosphohydrolase/phosphoribosyl-AMP cyclohydrolase